MAKDFFEDKASMLGKGISSLSRAIGEEARDVVSTLGNVAETPVEAAKTVGDYISGGIGALDLANVINLNPVLAAGKGIYDISRMSEKYDQQKIDDLAKYGGETTGLGTFARSLPLVGGIASFFSGPTTRPDLDLKFRTYLAQRGVDPNDYDGIPIFGPPAQAPVTQTLLPAPKGAKAAPWINPNLPRESYDFGDDGSGVTDQASFDDFASDVGFGVFNKGGIASLSA